MLSSYGGFGAFSIAQPGKKEKKNAENRRVS
jgi:hypothetical protein